MSRTRIYRHEDNGLGAKVFYNVSLSDLETDVYKDSVKISKPSRPKLHLSLEKMEHEIYHDAKREKVIFPPSITNLEFSYNETFKFMGLLVEATSTYMSAIRAKLYASNTLRMEMELENSSYKLLFHAVDKKYSGAGKSKNSARLVMSVFDKDTGEEVISVRLKKTKIIILLQIIKSLYEENISKFTKIYSDTEDNRLPMVRVDDMVAIGDVWIHGREVQKFQDYIERIIFDFKYRVSDGKEMFNYRQINASFSVIQDVAQITFTKFTDNHREYIDTNGNNRAYSFLINSEVAAIFYLMLPKAIAFDLGDIEMFAVDYNDDAAKELAEKRRLSRYYDEPEIIERNKDANIENGDFILNTIENQIVLRVDKNAKFSAKERKGRITLAAKYRDRVIEDENYKVGRSDADTGEFVEVEKLDTFAIDLRTDWLYIFALCAESVHSADSMKMNDFGNRSHLWRYDQGDVVSKNHYGIRVITDPGNKAPVVLTIDRHFDEFGDMHKDSMPREGGQRMRIPLFKEHVRTLLKGLIGLSAQFDNYYWMKKFPVYSDDCDEVIGEMKLGIIRSFDKKENKEVVSFGIIGIGSQQVFLTDSDRDTLFFSAYYRLMYGRWLQFSGEQISVSFDGWLTDRYNEYKIEFDLESSSGAMGSLPALAMLFATARKKKIVEKIEINNPELKEAHSA